VAKLPVDKKRKIENEEPPMSGSQPALSYRFSLGLASRRVPKRSCSVGDFSADDAPGGEPAFKVERLTPPTTA
jgi:hypothetical protein